MNDPNCTTIPYTPSIPFLLLLYYSSQLLPRWSMFGARLLCILMPKQTRPDSVSWQGGVEGGDRKDADDKDRVGGGDEHAGRGMWFLSALLSGVKSTENH